MKRCGVASTATVLSSLQHQEPVSEEHLLTETSGSRLSGEELAQIADNVDTRGMYMQELHYLCESFSALAPVTALYAEEMQGDTESARLALFRENIVTALTSPTQRVLLNYHMSTLGQVIDISV